LGDPGILRTSALPIFLVRQHLPPAEEDAMS
jgi:hypothetical protein